MSARDSKWAGSQDSLQELAKCMLRSVRAERLEGCTVLHCAAMSGDFGLVSPAHGMNIWTFACTYLHFFFHFNKFHFFLKKKKDSFYFQFSPLLKVHAISSIWEAVHRNRATHATRKQVQRQTANECWNLVEETDTDLKMKNALGQFFSLLECSTCLIC